MPALDQYVPREAASPSTHQNYQKPPLGYALGTIIDLSMPERPGRYGLMKSYILSFALDYGHPSVVKADGNPFILKDQLDNKLFVDRDTPLSARLRAMFPGITHDAMCKLTHVGPILGLKFYLYLINSTPKEIGGAIYTNIGTIESAQMAVGKPIGVFPFETGWVNLINQSGLAPTMTHVQLPTAQ